MYDYKSILTIGYICLLDVGTMFLILFMVYSASSSSLSFHLHNYDFHYQFHIHLHIHFIQCLKYMSCSAQYSKQCAPVQTLICNQRQIISFIIMLKFGLLGTSFYWSLSKIHQSQTTRPLLLCTLLRQYTININRALKI